jgi:nucleotide-binding universal stress UspA family protein
VEIIMTIVVGYVPTTEGEVVLASPAEEVRLPSQRLIVVSSSRGESSLAPAQPRTSAVSRLVAEVKIAGAAVDVDEKEKRPGRRDPRSRREVGASLVVVGLKNRSANGKLMLGTTAQTIMLKVPCSVIGLGA